MPFHYSTAIWNHRREGRDEYARTHARTHARTYARTHTNARNNTSSSSFFIHSSDPVKHSTIVRHQICCKQASKCVHRNVTATKHQECDAVLPENGRQRALQRTLVSRPHAAMFVHKVDESDVLRLHFVRIEVVAALLGVHVNGDPMFPRSIGAVGVAYDRGRVGVYDDIWQIVFGNDVARAAHQRVAR